MPVPSSINDLSTTAGSNYPTGSESPATLDDYQRAHAAFIAQLRDGKQVSDALLTAIAALTTANGKFMAFTGVDTVAVRDIVGTVSDSGGLPNGALFEYGSNANGHYIRTADGLQLCWIIGITTSAITTAAGSLFISAAFAWTLPAAFANTSYVVPGGSPAALNCWINGQPNTASAATCRAYSYSSIGASTGSLFAIGRWK